MVARWRVLGAFPFDLEVVELDNLNEDGIEVREVAKFAYDHAFRVLASGNEAREGG